MLLARTLEDKIAALYHSGKIIGGVYLGRGQEAFSAALAVRPPARPRHLRPPHPRPGRPHGLRRRHPRHRPHLPRQRQGPMRGRDGNIHRGRPDKGMPAMISHLGAMISVVCGMLMARQFRGIPTPSAPPASATAAPPPAPSTKPSTSPPSKNSRSSSPSPTTNSPTPPPPTASSPAAISWTAPSATASKATPSTAPTSPPALTVFEKAVARARAGHGPQMVVGKLLRLCGHGEHDDAAYIPDALKQAPLGRDCLKLARQKMLDRTLGHP